MADVRDLTIPAGDGHPVPVRVFVPEQAPRGIAVYLHGGAWVMGSIADSTPSPAAWPRAAATSSWPSTTGWRPSTRIRPPCTTPTRSCGGPRSSGRRTTSVPTRRWSSSGTAPAATWPRWRPGGRVTGAAPTSHCRSSSTRSRTPTPRPAPTSTRTTSCCVTRNAMVWAWDRYVPDVAMRRHPDVSPLLTDDLAGMPPTVLLAARYDPMYDEGLAYAGRLREAGVAGRPPRAPRPDARVLHDAEPAGQRGRDRPGRRGVGPNRSRPGERRGRRDEELLMTDARHIAADVDAVVVGAGFAGLYALHRLTRGSVSASRCSRPATASAAPGTGTATPAPGATSRAWTTPTPSPRTSKQEWEWTERYAAQPEILRYLDHVADRFDLRRDIAFNTRVDARHASTTAPAAGPSRPTSGDDDRVVPDHGVRLPVGGTGPGLPRPRDLPRARYHTGQWPHEGVDFAGRRVGVIGTGSSGIQAIPVMAEQADAAATSSSGRRTTACPHGNAPARPTTSSPR